MMNILFIGGTGFFGKAFINYIKTNNISDINQITIVGRSADSFLADNPEFKQLENIKYISADILNDMTQLEGHNFSHVVHAAADSTNISNLKHIDRFDQIVNGTRNILEFVRKKLPNAKLLFISSGAVYGEMLPNMNQFSEDFNGNTNNLESHNVYSIAKQTAEHLCSIYHDEYGLNISIARCFCFSGIHLPLNVHFAIGNFVQNVIDDKDIIIKGDGTSVRSYLDQDDMSEWILEILRNDKFNKTTYNIGSEESISIRELANLIINLSNKDLNVEIQNINSIDLKKSIYVPSCKKIQERFGISQKISLSESIIKMINNKSL